MQQQQQTRKKSSHSQDKSSAEKKFFLQEHTKQYAAGKLNKYSHPPLTTRNRNQPKSAISEEAIIGMGMGSQVSSKDVASNQSLSRER